MEALIAEMQRMTRRCFEGVGDERLGAFRCLRPYRTFLVCREKLLCFLSGGNLVSVHLIFVNERGDFKRIGAFIKGPPAVIDDDVLAFLVAPNGNSLLGIHRMRENDLCLFHGVCWGWWWKVFILSQFSQKTRKK